MDKKISVIIPCYNVESYIDRCIDSLVRQTIGIEQLELIFVDDASEDGTLERLKQWEKNYPQSILIIVCEKNGRQGTARNIGMEYASAPYISFVDADDWIELDMLLDMYETARSTGVEVVGAQSGRDWGDGKLCYTDNYGGVMNQKVLITEEEDRRMLLKRGLGDGVWGKLYQKSFIIENQLVFPEGVTYEDNFFGYLVLFSVTSYVMLEKRYYHYFLNTSSTVSTGNSLHQFDRLQVSAMTVEELERRGYGEKFHDEIEVYFLNTFYINTLHILFTRFETLPYDILTQMQQEVLRRYPNCVGDSAYENLGERGKVMLSTLARPFSHQEWEEIAESYREYCHELEMAYQAEHGQ